MADLTTEQMIERLFYEHEWRIFHALNDRHQGSGCFPESDLEALVSAGKLEWRADVLCIEGHTVWGGARNMTVATGQVGRHCDQCSDEERSYDSEDFTIDVRYVMSETWAAELGKSIRTWEACGGRGKVVAPASVPGAEACPVPNCHAGMLRDHNDRETVSCPICDGVLSPEGYRALLAATRAREVHGG